MLRACRNDNGSVLMLFPAAILIMFILAAITIDLTAVHARQRDLLAAATDAANDAATAGLDEAALRAGLGYRIDQNKAWFVAINVLATKGILDDLDNGIDLSIGEDGAVTVRLARQVPYVFANAIPGAPDSVTVRATATAQIQQR